MDLNGITPHLDRARCFLASEDPHQWIYAALELRFAFEAAAYRQVEAYGEDLPSTILRGWKPDQILKLLASFDDTSDQSAKWSISTQPLLDGNSELLEFKSLTYVEIGEQKRIPWKDFRKSYQTLGSFLHLDKQQQHQLPSRTKLQDLVAQLFEMSKSTLSVARKAFSSSTCECGERLVLGKSEMSGEQVIHCPNRKCNRIYRVHPNEPGQPLVQITQVVFACPSCNAQFPVEPNRLLEPAACPACHSRVRVVEVRLAVTPPESE